MITINELFRQDYAPGCFILIDDKHPLKLYAGADDSGNCAIEFRGLYKPTTIKSSSSIGIRHYVKSGYNCIVLSLLDSSMLDTFCVFANDIVDITRMAIDDKNGYQIIANRYYAWRKMFNRNSHLLDENEIMGLIGELLFLRDFIMPAYGTAKGLSSWSGQEKTKKDFSVEDTWYEIKTIHYGKDSVRISSLEQLDSVVDGHLVVYQLERMSTAFSGITLNSLCQEILSCLTSNETKDIFLEKLSNAGYTFESEYNEFVFDEKQIEKYSVGKDFPKLMRDKLPDAITKVQYDLLLATIATYKEQ